MFIAIAGGHACTEGLVAEGPDDPPKSIPNLPALPFHRIDFQEFKDRIERVNESLGETLKTPIRELQERTCSFVVSLPGAGSAPDNKYATASLEQAGWKGSAVRVIDDTWAALFAHTNEARGVCAYSGVGASVCVALGQFSLNPRYKIDGWGPIIGDYGSKFQLAIDLFRYLCRLRDHERASPLIEALRGVDETITGLSDVQRWFDLYIPQRNLEWPVLFSRFADVVIKEVASQNPDPHAVRIILEAADDMAESILIAATRLEAPARDFPFVLQGEMFVECSTYLHRVQSVLTAHRINAVLAQKQPIDGAFALSIKVPTSAKDAIILPE